MLLYSIWSDSVSGRCFILIHVAQVSLEIALVIFVFVLAVTVLYYGFRPGDGYLLLLTPLLFFLRIPYVVPLVVGLSGSLVSIVPVCSGVCAIQNPLNAMKTAMSRKARPVHWCRPGHLRRIAGTSCINPPSVMTALGQHMDGED